MPKKLFKILISLFACATLSIGAFACGETGPDEESSSTASSAVTSSEASSFESSFEEASSEEASVEESSSLEESSPEDSSLEGSSEVEGHTHVFNESTSTPETCLQPVYLLSACECGESTVLEIRAPLGHNVENGACTRCLKTESTGLKFTAEGDGYAVAGKGVCQDTDIIVPSMHFGLPVISVAKEAFREENTIKSVYLPDSVKTVSDSAFWNCTKLKDLWINGATNVSARAVDRCPLLRSVTFGASVEGIAENAIAECPIVEGIFAVEGNDAYRSVNGVLYTEDMTTLMQYASGGTATEFVVPEGVTKIAQNAFAYNETLKDVTLPNSLEEVGAFAFYRSAIASVEFPETLKTIGENAFGYCLGLDGALVLPEGLETIGAYAFVGCEELTGRLTIPSTVVSVGEFAFFECFKLQWLTLGEKVENIGSYAFYYCYNLSESLAIPDSVTSIGSYAFAWCYGLKNVTFGEKLETIGEYAFYYCTALGGELALPDTLTVIGDYAFSYAKITTISGGDGLQAIGGYAFEKCTRLKTVYLGESLVSIAKYAFNGCTSISSVTFAVTTGWRVSDQDDMLVSTAVNSADLSTTSKAAKQLRATNNAKFWQRG